MMIELLGILGGFCFAFCGIPTLYSTVKLGRSIGTPVSIALAMIIGSVLMYSYLTLKYGLDIILTINYTISVITWGLIAFYHYFPTAIGYRAHLKSQKRKISDDKVNF